MLRSVWSDSDPPDILTDYIATRWCRAPEILFGSPSYTCAVELVSAEESAVDQLERLTAVRDGY
jgi:hypothetical protein